MSIIKFEISGAVNWKGAAIVDAHNSLETFPFAGDTFSHDVPDSNLAIFTFWAKGPVGTKINVTIKKNDKNIVNPRFYTIGDSAGITRDIQFDPAE